MTARQAASASVAICSARSVCQASAKPETPEQVANRLLLCDITPGYGAAGDRDARATLSRLRRSSVRGSSTNSDVIRASSSARISSRRSASPGALLRSAVRSA